MAELNITTIELPMPGMLGTVNCYLLKNDGRAVLIDTGMADERTVEQLAKKLIQLDVSICDLEKVICTHYHPDHCGLGKYFQNEGVTVAMSSTDAAALQQYFEYPHVDANRATFYGEHEISSAIVDNVVSMFAYLRTLHQAFVPDEVLKDGQQISLAGVPFELLETPGHTDGHLCLLHRPTGTLITGDHILKGSTVHLGLRREFRNKSPLMSYLKSLDRIASLGPLRGLTGHGKTIENTEHRCRELIQLYEQRTIRVKEVLTETPMGANEVSEMAFGVKRRPFSKWLCMAQTISSLEYLECLNCIGRGEKGNKQTYWAVKW